MLKPRGCLAIYGYNDEIKDNKRVKNALAVSREAFMQFNCIDKKTMNVFNGYKAVKLPFSQTERIEFDVPQHASMDQVLGFLSSTAAYRSYCKIYPENNLF